MVTMPSESIFVIFQVFFNIVLLKSWDYKFYLLINSLFFLKNKSFSKKELLKVLNKIYLEKIKDGLFFTLFEFVELVEISNEPI